MSDHQDRARALPVGRWQQATRSDVEQALRELLRQCEGMPDNSLCMRLAMDNARKVLGEQL